jgi:ribosomal protein S18 acetylase RimI-like enzyme
VRLWVTEGNERATALYRKLGFVPTGRRIVRERDSMAEIEMTREP